MAAPNRIKIWGRANSGNVKKVLVVADELKIPYDRIDAGLTYGVVDTPEYRKLNPNGRVPAIEDGDFVLWESHAICRYLCLQYGGEAIYPSDPKRRASVERWLDWLHTTIIPVDVPLFWGTVRTPPEKWDRAAIADNTKKLAAIMQILNDRLEGRSYIDGDQLTLADLVLGIFGHRYLKNPHIERPAQPNLSAWWERLRVRPSYQAHVDLPVS